MDLWTISSAINAISVMEYFNDKDRLEREKQHEYSLCFDEIGASVECLGNTVLAVLEKSEHRDWDDTILKGAKQLALHIFLRVAMMQGKPLTKHQMKIINIYFTNIHDCGILMDDYLAALKTDNDARRELESSMIISPNECGSFWNEFIKLLYLIDADEDLLLTIVRCYTESAYRFAFLGDCKPNRVEHLCNEFKMGFQRALQNSDYDRTDMDIERINGCIKGMRDACESIRDEGTEEEEILIDVFDFFLIAIIIGILERMDAHQTEKAEILQRILEQICVDAPLSAEEIYEKYMIEDGIKRLFYDFANDWEDVNFWKIVFIAASKVSLNDKAIKFMEEALDYIQAVGRMISKEFSQAMAEDAAKEYKENVALQMDLFLRNAL